MSTPEDLVQRRAQLNESKKALLAAWLKGKVPAGSGGSQGGASRFPPVVPDGARRGEPFPWTEVQRRWGGTTGQPGPAPCFYYVEIDGRALDGDRLAETWRKMVERHDMLRAVGAGEGLQRILTTIDPGEMPIRDLTETDPGAAEERLAAIREEIIAAGFGAEPRPPVRISVTRRPDGSARAHLLLDLLRLDEPSLHVLVMQWGRLYRDPSSAPAPLELSFRDYVLGWEASAASAEAGKAWWRERLATLPPGPDVSVGAAAAAAAEGRQTPPRAVHRRARIPAAAWQRLKTRAGTESLSASGCLLAAFAEVLGQWSRDKRFTIDTVSFDRLPLHPQVNDILGNFVSLLPVVVDNTGPEPFGARARNQQRQLWEAAEHWYARPLDQHAGASVVFTSALAAFTAGDVAVAHAAREVETPFGWLGEITLERSVRPGVWLENQVQEDRGDLVVTWFYRADVRPDVPIDEMLAAYHRLIVELSERDATWQKAAS